MISSSHLIAQLAAVPIDLQRLLADRTDADLSRPGHDGGPGAIEFLCDWRDWEEITGQRVARILHEDNPTLEPQDNALWPIEHAYAAESGTQVLAAFLLLREALVTQLGRCTPEEWLRPATLITHGEITLRSLVERTIRHDQRRLREIVEVLH